MSPRKYRYVTQKENAMSCHNLFLTLTPEKGGYGCSWVVNTSVGRSGPWMAYLSN